jgi:endonuclease/exonuclease/phosphatase family metal-dependent hydrolase
MCRFTGVGKHDIGKLADIFLTEHFDIIALQEVFRPEAVDILLKRLPGWKGSHGRPSLDKAGDYGFAFLWNPNRVKECSKNGCPIIFEQYKTQNIRMRRNPLYGRFTPSGLIGGSFFEIRLIDVHLWWGSQSGPPDINQRDKEYELITGEIHDYINTHRYGNFKPAYTIILGDFNMVSFWCHAKEQQTDKNNVRTHQEEKTTISGNNDSFANDYDHFAFDDNRFNATTTIIERVDSVQKYCRNNFEVHRAEISDHIPIKMELVLKKGNTNVFFKKEL